MSSGVASRGMGEGIGAWRATVSAPGAARVYRFPVPNPLSISLAGLRRDDPTLPWAAGARAAVDWAGTLGVRAVQLDATAAGLRPRELDRSARRDLAALLRRRELELSGLDLWLPGEHLIDPAHVDRAAGAIVAAIGLAAEIAPLAGGVAGRCVSVMLPAKIGRDVLAQIGAEAERQGVRLADHAWPPGAERQERGHASGQDAKSAGDASEGREVEGAHASAKASAGSAGRWPHSIGIGLDPAAVALAGEDIGSAAARAADQMVSARLCDLSSAGRVLPGSADGRLDLLAYRVSLSLAKGVVPVVVDVRGLAEQDAAARRMIESWGAGS